MLLYKKTIIFCFIAGILAGLGICLFSSYTQQIRRESYHHVASGFMQAPNMASTKNTDIPKVYQSLCAREKTLCQKLMYQGEYTEAVKQAYAIITLYFVKTLDTFVGSTYLINTIEKVYISGERDLRRGYSTHRSVFLHTPGLSHKEYMMVLIHELGHIIDLGILQGQSKKKNTYFTEFGQESFAIDDISLQYYTLSRDSEYQRKNIETRQSFCSIYGMSNPFEDFAECFQLYMNHQDYFRHLSKDNNTLAKKYAFFEQLFDGRYLYNKLQVIPKKNDTQYRYRDSTRML